MTRQVLLDTNIFNQILDGACDVAAFDECRVFVTHIQKDELANTSDKKRRQKLLEVFHTIPMVNIETQTSLWDDTPWDQGRWSSENGIYETLVSRVRELDRKSRSLNQSRDARIAEVAIANNLTLITNDPELTTAAKECGCHVLSLMEFQEVDESN